MEEKLRTVMEEKELLNQQIEEDRDLIDELRDRLGNLKVHAQAKEVYITS